jgi:hypothetical protein
MTCHVAPICSIMFESKTRCAIHNGHAINLISKIDIYDKLVIYIYIYIYIYNVHHVVGGKKNHFFHFIFHFFTSH